MMLSYVRYAQAHSGLFDLMTGPRLLREFVRGDVEATSNISYSFFADSVFALARVSGWPEEQMHYLSHAAWSMEHGVAALILADRIPRTDSNIELEKLIDFSISTFLATVVGGPDRFAKDCDQRAPKRRSN